MRKNKKQAELTPSGQLDALAKGGGASVGWLLQMAQVAPNLPPEILEELISAGELGIPIAKRVMLKKLGDMDKGDSEARAKIRYGEVAKPVVDLALMLATVLGTRKQSATLSPSQVDQLQKDYDRLQKEIENLDRLEQATVSESLPASKEVIEAEVVDGE